jgi:hypothetical protein
MLPQAGAEPQEENPSLAAAMEGMSFSEAMKAEVLEYCGQCQRAGTTQETVARELGLSPWMLFHRTVSSSGQGEVLLESICTIFSSNVPSLGAMGAGGFQDSE